MYWLVLLPIYLKYTIINVVITQNIEHLCMYISEKLNFRCLWFILSQLFQHMGFSSYFLMRFLQTFQVFSTVINGEYVYRIKCFYFLSCWVIFCFMYLSLTSYKDLVGILINHQDKLHQDKFYLKGLPKRKMYFILQSWKL